MSLFPERRLRAVGRRIERARADLAVTDEQLLQLADESDDAGIRALVSDGPEAGLDATAAQRHTAAMQRHRRQLADTIAKLEAEQDELLDQMVAPAAGGQVTDGAAVEATAGEPLRIVVAEDDAIIRMDLCMILREEGYDVVGDCGQGDLAIDLIRELRPDVAILDVKMPGLDGISAAREVSAERLCAVVLLTAFSQRKLIESAWDAGVMAYLVKPFQREDLVPAIELAVGRFLELVALADHSSALEDQLATRKLSDRAKALLISSHGMTEEEAFRFLQRGAMNRRVPMRQVAEEVLSGELAP